MPEQDFLDVDFVRDQRHIIRQTFRVVPGHSQRSERQAVAELAFFAHGFCRRTDGADEIHVGHQFGFCGKCRGIGPVRQMYAFLSRQAAVDVLARQRQKRRQRFGKRRQDGVQDVKCVLTLFKVPESGTAAADVPVVQDFQEIGHIRARADNVAFVQLGCQPDDQVMKLRQNVAIQNVFGGRERFRLQPFGIGVQAEEMEGVPQRDQRLT